MVNSHKHDGHGQDERDGVDDSEDRLDADGEWDQEDEEAEDVDEQCASASESRPPQPKKRRTRAELAIARRSVVGLGLAVGLVFVLVSVEWDSQPDNNAPWTEFPGSDEVENLDQSPRDPEDESFQLPAAALGRVEVGLQGSRASMERQHRKAESVGAKFYRSGKDLRRAQSQGVLEKIRDSRHIELANVSYPFAHPQSARLIQLLGQGHARACARPLVVTSVARPRNEQPSNASTLSVHPAGLAFDLRSGIEAKCRRWLESKLLELEGRGLLDVTQEHRPPHFHVAVFADRVRRLSRGRLRQSMGLPAGLQRGQRSQRASRPTDRTSPTRRGRWRTSHEVVSGDSLWRIANRHGCSVEAIQKLNGLKGERIFAGQTLKLPSTN